MWRGQGRGIRLAGLLSGEFVSVTGPACRRAALASRFCLITFNSPYLTCLAPCSYLGLASSLPPHGWRWRYGRDRDSGRRDLATGEIHASSLSGGERMRAMGQIIWPVWRQHSGGESGKDNAGAMAVSGGLDLAQDR
jgi:hypothetical protein